MPFRRCSRQKILKISTDYRGDSFTWRFITSLSRMLPFPKTNEEKCFIHLGQRMLVGFLWDQGISHENPVLAAHISRKPFPINVRAIISCLQCSTGPDEWWWPVVVQYYLSTINLVEQHYNPIEKEYLPLVFIIKKVDQYLVSQITHIISQVNPLQILMAQHVLLKCRLAKSAILLS